MPNRLILGVWGLFGVACHTLALDLDEYCPDDPLAETCPGDHDSCDPYECMAYCINHFPDGEDVPEDGMGDWCDAVPPYGVFCRDHMDLSACQGWCLAHHLGCAQADGDADADNDVDWDADEASDGHRDSDTSFDADQDHDSGTDTDAPPDGDSDADTDTDTDAQVCSSGCEGECGLGEWVTICAGDFVMGSPEDEGGRFPSETERTVTLTRDFQILSTEVTQEDYRTVMGQNPSYFAGCTACPVENVNWHQAAAYCNELSADSLLSECYDCHINENDLIKCELKARYTTPYDCPGIRLPTSAEWEYAARAGVGGAQYAPLDDLAWYRENSEGFTHPVGGLLPNAWGLYDVLGNVAEMVNDTICLEEAEPHPVTDPYTFEDDSWELLGWITRGGSYDQNMLFVRLAMEHPTGHESSQRSIGFRIARTMIDRDMGAQQ